jgi:acetyl-CoA acetyltransferase
MEMYRQALLLLLDEWKLGPSDIQGIMAAPGGMALGDSGTPPELLTHEKLMNDLGIEPQFAETINAGGATYGVMIQRAALAISAGLTESVLCVGAGKFPAMGPGGAEALAKTVSHPEFEYPYGPALYSMYAQTATRHMADYGTTREHLARVAVSARKWAMLHPDALMRPKGEITIEDVLSSRKICSPFNMLDCSVPSEGGGAILVTSKELALRINPQPAYLLGMGEYHTHGYITQAPSLTTLGADVTGQKAYAMAGLAPQDVDVVQLYDAFSFNPIALLEDLGFCEKGKGGQFVAEGHTDPGGSLPMNTYGGLLSYGHVGDASGLSMIAEGALQVMGRAGARQVPDANVVLAHTYGGMIGDHSTLIFGSQQ